MKNELVEETKDICKDIYESLKAKHAELKKEGAGVTILNELVKDMKAAIRLYNDVDEENAEIIRTEAINLGKNINYKYHILEDVAPELLQDEELDDDDEEMTDSRKVARKENAKRSIAAELALVTALAGITVHSGCLNKKIRSYLEARTETVEEVEEPVITKKVAEVKETPVVTPVVPVVPTMEPTAEPTAVPTAVPTVAPTVAPTAEPVQVPVITLSNTATPAPQQLVLGEYGTFFDVEDDEQVNARAQYIYDNYFANNSSLTPQQRQLITPENIANTIRVMNGVLPIDQNGNQFMNGTTLDDYTNILVEMVVNVGSNVNDHYEFFPSHLLFVDGSPESEFVKSYDVIYDKLVYSLNEHDDEQVQDAIACLGLKFNKEWFLQGMYGDVNPHLMDSDKKYLLFITTIEPYNTTAREWHLSEKKPVCIKGCKNYETGEEELISVNDLQTALETGAWNHIGAKLGGMDVETHSWLEDYYEVLFEALSWKYDHRQTLSKTY